MNHLHLVDSLYYIAVKGFKKLNFLCFDKSSINKKGDVFLIKQPYLSVLLDSAFKCLKGFFQSLFSENSKKPTI